MTDREPRDVVRILKEWLKSDMAARFPELSVRLELTDDWTLGHDPILLLSDDGDPTIGRFWPVATSPTIRVTSWTSGRDRTYVNAALTRLLCAKIPGIASLRASTGMVDARDPSTGGDLSSFTVRARCRLAVPQ